VALVDRKEVAREDWAKLLDEVTKGCRGQPTTIEVLGSDIGDQMEAEQLPLAYIEYDHKDDVVIVALGGQDGRHPVVLQHIIEHPETILADELPPAIAWAILVTTPDGTKTVVSIAGKD
jgi:hypothetical protein